MLCHSGKMALLWFFCSMLCQRNKLDLPRSHVKTSLKSGFMKKEREEEEEAKDEVSSESSPIKLAL